jgi:hypothetical protein
MLPKSMTLRWILVLREGEFQTKYVRYTAFFGGVVAVMPSRALKAARRGLH